MTLEQVFFASQSIAAAGGIAALIFVGLQDRDSAKAVRANTAEEVSESFSNLYRWLSDNPSMLENWITGLRDIGALASAETARFMSTHVAIMALCQNALISGARVIYGQTCGSAGNERAYLFSKEFQAEVKLAMSRQAHPLTKTLGVVAVGSRESIRRACVLGARSDIAQPE